MKLLNYNNLNIYKNSIYGHQNSAPQQVNFGAQRDKLINQILNARPKHVQITTEQISSLLINEGFDVSILKGFMIAKKDGLPTFKAAVSRGERKFADPQAIVRLKKYFSGETK